MMPAKHQLEAQIAQQHVQAMQQEKQGGTDGQKDGFAE